MEITIRRARLEDRAALEPFTTDTFSWGDYVQDRLPQWIEDPDSQPLVAVDAGGRAVGFASGRMLSRDEAWAQAIRIHPDARRQGIGSKLNEAICKWAAGQGARVVRLAIEDWNEPAQRQVAKLAFRPVARFLMADRAVGEASPNPAGNGGQRLRRGERLRRSPEGELAYMAWDRGELAAAAHLLFATEWTWRKMTLRDVREAAARGMLLEAPTGWAIAENTAGTFLVRWITTTLVEAPAFVRALVDRAVEADVERLEVSCPNVDWLARALRRAAMELHPLTVFARTAS